jgi:hypothetical protein
VLGVVGLDLEAVDRAGAAGCRSPHRRFTHTKRAGRPKHSRSRYVTAAGPAMHPAPRISSTPSPRRWSQRSPSARHPPRPRPGPATRPDPATPQPDQYCQPRRGPPRSLLPSDGCNDDGHTVELRKTRRRTHAPRTQTMGTRQSPRRPHRIGPRRPDQTLRTSTAGPRPNSANASAPTVNASGAVRTAASPPALDALISLAEALNLSCDYLLIHGALHGAS